MWMSFVPCFGFASSCWQSSRSELPNIGSPSSLLKSGYMIFESIHRADPLQGLKGLSNACVFREMNRTRRKVGQEHAEGFVGKDCHDSAGHQRKVFGGSSLGILNGAELPDRTSCMHLCLRHWRNDEFSRSSILFEIDILTQR